MEIPDIMWSLPYEYVASYMTCQERLMNVDKCSTYPSLVGANSTKHVSIMHSDTMKLFRIISTVVEHERVNIMNRSPSTSLGLVMIRWSDQFKESVRKRLLLPVYDEFGSGTILFCIILLFPLLISFLEFDQVHTSETGN